MNKFIELHNILKSNISTCSTIDEKELIKKALGNNLPGIGIVDYYEITSFIKFERTIKEINLKNFKAIYGIVLNIKVENKIYKSILYPLNNNGLKDLYKLVFIHSKKNFLDIYDFMKYEDNITIGIALDKKEEDNILEYFDFIEVSPFNKELINELKNYAVILSNRPNRLEKDNLPNKILANYTNSDIDKYGYYLSDDEINDIPKELLNNNLNLFNIIENITIEEKEDEIQDNEIINTIYKIIKDKKSVDSIRLNREIKVIKDNNLTNIFNIAYKIFTEAKYINTYIFFKSPLDQFYISYLLGMTKINPIKLNLEIPTKINEINIEVLEDKKEELVNSIKNIIPSLTNRTSYFKINKYKAKNIIKDYLTKNNIVLSKEKTETIENKITNYAYKKYIHPYKFGFNKKENSIYPKTSYEDKNTYTYDFDDIKNNFYSLTITSYNYINFLKKLETITNTNIEEIDLNDSNVLELFTSLKPLNITPDKVFRETGNIGLAYFHKHNDSYALHRINPKNIYELINTFSYNLDVIKDYKDITNFLLNENKSYYDLIYKVLISYYYAYYKLYYPLEFYKTMLDYHPNIESNKHILIEEYEKIKEEYLKLNDVDIETLTTKILNTKEFLDLEVLEYALEITLRGYKFKIDYNQLEKINIDKEKGIIIIRGNDNYE